MYSVPENLEKITLSPTFSKILTSSPSTIPPLPTAITSAKTGFSSAEDGSKIPLSVCLQSCFISLTTILSSNGCSFIFSPFSNYSKFCLVSKILFATNLNFLSKARLSGHKIYYFFGLQEYFKIIFCRGQHLVPIIQTNSGYGYVYRSSSKKSKSLPPFFRLLVIFLAVIVVTTAGIFLSSKISKFFGVNDSFLINDKTFFAVSGGECEDYSSASLLSQTILKQGGAGYIYKTGNKYCVLLSCYQSSSDAQNVLQNLEQNNISASVVEIKIPKIKVTSELSSTNLKTLKNAVNMFCDTYQKLYDLSVNYDSKVLSRVESNEELDRIIALGTSVYEKFCSEVCDSTNALSVYLKVFLSDMLEQLGALKLVQENFSGQIKKTYFSVLNLYANFRQEIEN